MTRYLLDTKIISELVRPDPNSRVVERYRKHVREAAIASPVWHELLFGVKRLRAGRRRDTLSRNMHDVIRASMPVLPYDDEAARWHAKERARLEVLGQPRAFVDGMIAAIAATSAVIVVTRNTVDFCRVRRHSYRRLVRGVINRRIEYASVAIALALWHPRTR